MHFIYVYTILIIYKGQRADAESHAHIDTRIYLSSEMRLDVNSYEARH